MEIKAIFMDLDGTLLKSDRTLSQNLKNKLKELENRGVKIFIATGRTYGASLSAIKELDVKTPVINYNGGRITDTVTGEVIYENPLPEKIVEEIIKISREKKIHLNLYRDDNLYIENESEEGKGYAEHAGIPYTLINFDDFAGKTSTKALFLGEHEKLKKLKEELEKKFSETDFVFSQYTYLEVLNKGVSKGKAVKEIMKRYDLSSDEVMAFGDQWNDLSMLKSVKYGYLMGNALDELKKEFPSDRITLSNDDDGIYYIIKDK